MWRPRRPEMGAYFRSELGEATTQAIVARWLATLRDLDPMVQAYSMLHYSVMSSTFAKAMASSFSCIVFSGNVGLPRRSPISGTVRLKL